MKEHKMKEQLDEAHKLNDTVIMSYPSLKGVKGTIGEIRHAAYKGGPKTYTIDYQHPKHSVKHTSSIQLSSTQFKAHKEGTLGEETLDELSMTTVKSYKAKVATNPAPSKTTSDVLHKAIRRFAGKERAEDRIHHDEMKKMRTRLGLKEEILEAAVQPNHKVGDTVWATLPTNKAVTMTGKVIKIGQTLTTIKHKDGSEAHYPHELVDNDYEVLHPNPYKKLQREHLEQTGELLTLAEVKYMVENANGGAGTIAQHAGVNGEPPVGTGKVKKMMGNKTSVDAIVKIIAKGAKTN